MDLSKMTLAQLAEALLAVGQKTATGGTPTATMGHGPGGLFSGMGLSRPLFSAMAMPQIGLQSILPTKPSNERNPLFGIVTGVTASSGSEPTGVCDDPPVIGLAKLCTHSFLFGRYSRMTKVYDTDNFGAVINRGEFTDLQMMNLPGFDSPQIPSIPGSAPSDLARREVAKAMFEFATAWGRDFARQIFVGSPSNNTAGGGYKEFYGLDTLINTGYQDAETGQLCPAADSTIMSFGHWQLNTHGSELVMYVTAIYRQLSQIARATGLMPVKWAIVMANQLFYAITEVWPCSYASYRCNVKDNAFGIDAVPSLSVEASNKMREEMRQGSYLLIDGVQVPVIIDDGVAETMAANGVWESEIYFVPLTVIGGTPVTYMEYFNYDTPGGAMDAARLFAPDGTFYSTDGGRFFWVKKPPNNFCVQLLAKTESRLMLLTPFIAARLTDVCYTLLMPMRDWDPSGPSYYVDGGKTHDPLGGPSYYPPVREMQ